MKLRFQSHWSHRCRGITLIECLVYIGTLAVVFGMGLAAFHRCVENSVALRRNSDDITQALTTGEQWRADIRAASQSPRFDPATQTLRIPQRTTEVTYRFSENTIARRASTNAEWKIVLPRVEQSAMSLDSRSQVTAWRWELELKSRHQPALLRPLFTFTAATVQP
jgi:Tfp pilus assembly protein FimT